MSGIGCVRLVAEGGEKETPMKSRIRIAGATLVVAAGLTAAVAAPLSAAPTNPPQVKAAMAVCAAQDGTFAFSTFNGIVNFYNCTKTTNFSADQVQTARTICLNSLGKAFPSGVIFSPPTNTPTTQYACGVD
jgi:hypothetical protein